MNRCIPAARRSRARRLGLAAVGSTLAFASGCYTYTQIPVDAAPVGENVRLVVTRAGVPELGTIAEGLPVAPEIRGRVTGTEAGSVLLRVPLDSDRERAPRVLDIAQVVRVPTDEILSMELQSFSRARTSLLVAGAVAAGGFLVLEIIDATRRSDEIDQPDPEVFLRLLRIPIG